MVSTGALPVLPFADRAEAGRLLARKLSACVEAGNVIVAGLPRGGVPVAFEVAHQFQCPLDVMVVRKLGAPQQPELAMGAVASGGIRVLDYRMVRQLDVADAHVDRLIAKAEREIEAQEVLFRGGYPAQSLSGRTVILVDDGAATGSSMLAAAAAVRKQQPKEIIVALPVASREGCEQLNAEAGKCLCLATPQPFLSVSQWYESFGQLADDDVRELLARARRESLKERAGHAS